MSKGMGRKTTIEDIARQAHVSIKTVSRVINNEPYVRDETRARVLQAAKQLGYEPNISARQLASKRSFVVAHFYDNPTLDYVARVYEGMRNACNQVGYYAIAEQLKVSRQSYRSSLLDYLQRFAIDGAILSPPLCDDQRLVETLLERGIPCGLISPGHANDYCTNVMIDDANAAAQVADLMVAAEHKKFAFVSGLKSHMASANREAGFLQRLHNHNVAKKDVFIVRGDFSLKSGFEAYENIIQRHPDITSVFATNDDMAAGVIMAALKHGKMVPDNLQVVGFDDSPLARTMWPSITTVAQPVGLMAETAVRQLLRQITTGRCDAQPIVLETKIMLRESCAPER